MKKTAADLIAELQADPNYLRRRYEQEHQRAKQIAQWHQAEEPLITELQSIGIAVKSAWDLINSVGKYPTALPILVAHLQRPYPAPVREGIARALATPEARFAWETLVRLYHDENESRTKDGLAVALAAITDGGTIEDLIRLLKDKQNGPSRVLLLSALERSTDPRADKALLELESDEELKHEVGRVLTRRMKKPSPRRKSSNDVSKDLSGFNPSLSEVSMNFDADMVEPFLKKMSASVAGFGPAQVAEVISAVNQLNVDDERVLAFRIDHNGRPAQIDIRIFKDDIDAVDLFFSAPRRLKQEIQRLMDVFSAEQGI